jgi:tetratricopeptide (TPR) repeat protein
MKVMQQKQIIVTVLIVLYVLSQSYWIFKWFDKGTYDLKRTGEDLAQIVNPEAVIIGPYAPALTIDNKLKSFIYMFGLARKEPALLQQFPITHLALDVTNWGAAVKDYPQCKNVLEVGRYWVRDVEIRVLKLDDLTLKKYGRAYRPSDFEIGAYYYARNQLDSVGIYLNRFLAVYPHSKSGLSTLTGANFRAARFKEGLAICDRLLEYYPGDFSLWFDKAVYCYKLYRSNHDAAMLAESERLFNRALELNPYLGEDIALAKKQADEATR